MNQPVSPPHLLTLPREIRNNIYGYLTRDLELRTIKSLGNFKAIVGLLNAPYISVLLTHSRLQDEYLESDSFQKLSATILIPGNSADMWSWPADADTMILRDNNALSYVKIVTLRFAHRLAAENSTPIELIDALAFKVLSLHTIRITEASLITSFEDQTLPQNLNFPARDKMKPLPETLASLPLVQRANCRWLHSLPASITTPGATADDGKIHVLLQVRVHLYSLRRSKKDMWTARGTSSYWKLRGHPERVTKQLPGYNSVERKSYSERVVGWVEERKDVVDV